MRDWKGNEIKDGDNIVIIRTKPLFSNTSCGFIIPMNDAKDKNKWIEVKSDPIDDTYYWDVCREYSIHEFNGTLFRHFKSSDGMTYIQTLESLTMFGWDDDSLIAIKGKTDNKEMYYGIKYK